VGRACRRAAGLVAALALAGAGCSDRDLPAGEVTAVRRPAEEVAAARAARTRVAAELAARRGTAPAPKQILFGDLHVHSTWSIDAFVGALPIMGGEGAHPPADACDHARHCAALDFFSINDHAESLLPERWERTKESIRACNAAAGDPSDPDLVAFLGFEWTQVGRTPENHYGHRNVVIRSLEEGRIPPRPIAALPRGITRRAAPVPVLRALQAVLSLGADPYADFLGWIARMARVPDCPEGVDPRELPRGCRESALTPAELFRRLAPWRDEVLVIPHGLAWGLHAPAGADLRHTLAAGEHDPLFEPLLEVFSGHGNSEEYRPLPEPRLAGDEVICPEPTDDFLPCCWRAGEIVLERCQAAPDVCRERAAEARRLAALAGLEFERVLPDAEPADWLDCDQCRDCFKPAMSPKPKMTAQYAVALSEPDPADPEGRPRRFRFGFIASSDNHRARAATGYKQEQRRRTTDADGLASRRLAGWLRPWLMGRSEEPGLPRAVPEEPPGLRDLLDTERVGSFLYPGGAVAVHAAGRSREAIWEALRRREAYGTSGPRILLWFDLLNGPDGRAPMGSHLALSETPRFEVRAAGDFEQLPGCPGSARAALGPERAERLCAGACYHPGGHRRRIEAIEVVRIRPQRTAEEPVPPLVEDPWRTLPCPPDPAGCAVRFEDPDFARDGRDTVYYVRALQEPTPAINGAGMRPVRDEAGRVVAVRPCYATWRTPEEDDCLAPVRERAWSSPIYLDHASPGTGAGPDPEEDG